MANTEGIPDEKLASLLSINENDYNGGRQSNAKTNSKTNYNANTNTTTNIRVGNRNTKKLHRGLIERQRMMDAFEDGGDVPPSATVIRTSNRKPPIVKSKSVRAGASIGTSTGTNTSKSVSFQQENRHSEAEAKTKAKEKTETETETETTKAPQPPPPAPVLLSHSIKERPIRNIIQSSSSSFQNKINGSNKKVSRFKSNMRQTEDQGTSSSSGHNNANGNENDTNGGTRNMNPTTGIILPHHKSGFPSFDLPVGSLTRKGKVQSKFKQRQQQKQQSQQMQQMQTANNSNSNSNSNNDNNNDDVTSSATQNPNDSVIGNMTQEQIKDSVAEIEGMLSVETIQFLKNRKKLNSKKSCGSSNSDKTDNSNKQLNTTASTESTVSHTLKDKNMTTTKINTSATVPITSAATSREEKEKIAKVLSNIKTEEELDELYARTMGINIHMNNNVNTTNTTTTTTTTTEHDTTNGIEINDNNATTTNTIIEETVETELDPATRLLRSTALRQRLLGAKTICHLLEKQIVTLGLNVQEQKQEQGKRYGTIESNKDSNTNTNTYDTFPVLLPVALRCLLDLPSPKKHSILFSYVLRSFHMLVLLYSHSENHVYFNTTTFERQITSGGGNSGSSSGSGSTGRNGDTKDSASIYQLNFMNDNVPIPPSSRLYSTIPISQKSDNDDNDTDDNNNNNDSNKKEMQGVGCYSTDSSAESAEKDGQAFYADPLWTLLSRMRILPCISHILDTYSSTAGSNSSHKRGNEISDRLSVESITSICAILSMLSIRSPGAACAIAQHKTIMPCIISMTLEPILNDATTVTTTSKDNKPDNVQVQGGGSGSNNDFVVHTKFALPAIRLICTLCRQSKTVAISNWMSSVMENVIIILATNVEKRDEWEIQKWCIILWRTMLRYGLAISYTSTILPLSISHLTSQDEHEFSLSSHYLTSYAALCDCVKATIDDDGSTNTPIVNEYDRHVLDGCSMGLASHLKSCANFLKDSVESSSTSSHYDDAKAMCLASARIRLLTSYTTASDIMKSQSNSLTVIPLISRNSCIQALNGVVRSKLLYKAIKSVLDQSSSDTNGSWEKSNEIEASACTLIYSFFTALYGLLRQDDKEVGVNKETKEELFHLVSKIFSHVINVFKANHSLSLNVLDENSSCQKSWRNKAHFSIGRFMTITLSTRSSVLGIESTKLALPLIQSFVFTLIGRLDRGEEAMAAMLVSQSILFEISEDEEQYSSFHSVRHVQEVLLREIMATSHQSQVQLDHSFKLLGGHEISHNGGGPFHLESLRSEADRSMSSQSKSTDVNKGQCEVVSLPLGDDWLFKLLSGNIDLGDDPEQKISRLQGTSDIVLSTLRLIIYMEKANTQYTKYTPSGSKIYFLMNACLFPEEIIRRDLFGPLFNELFHIYELSQDQGNNDKARTFILTCYQHSSPFKQKIQSTMTGTTMKVKNNNIITEDQVLELFFNSTSTTTKSNNNDKESKMKLSPKHMKAVDDFISDLCTAFTTYGAQYDIFCYSIRFLLMSGFPLRNVLMVLNRLKDLLHLLTTEEESEYLVQLTSSSSSSSSSSISALQQALKRSLSGGLPIKDGSKRDSAELLDVIHSLQSSSEKYSTIQKGGFFYLYTVGCFARNLASSSTQCDCGLSVMKKRMKGLALGFGLNDDHRLLDDIVNVSFSLMKDVNGDVDALTEAIVKICCSRIVKEGEGGEDLIDQSSSSSSLKGWAKSGFHDEIWDQMVSKLRQSLQK